MRLSIIIPVFNEEKTVGAILEKLANLNLGRWEKEIIVVNDGSTDNSKKIVEKYGIKLISHQKNLGKGAAIKTGLAQSTGDAIIIQDADLEYDPNDFLKMLKEFETGKYDAVYGSRNLKPKRRGYPHYVLGVAILSWFTNILYGSKLTDIYTCYKLVKTSVFKNLKIESRGFELEAEITAKLLRARRKIAEVPISYYPRKFSEGKKIRFKDAVVGFWTIIKNRL